MLYLLAEVTIINSASILIVALLRKPVRAMAGPQIAYWLWLLVPITAVAAALPAPSPALTLPQTVFSGLPGITALPAIGNAPVEASALTLSVWGCGSFAMFWLLVLRQRALVRSLGEMTPGPEGAYYSGSISGPMLVGFWRPCVVLPADFESRYDPQERALVLAHEQAHLQRRWQMRSPRSGFVCVGSIL